MIWMLLDFALLFLPSILLNNTIYMCDKIEDDVKDTRHTILYIDR